MNLLTPKEVAEICNVSIHTVTGWRRFDKGPPAVKIGGRWRYNSEELKKWLNQQKS